MKFSDYCDKINSSFSTKFSNYEFIFKLFDSLSSSHFKSEGTSDKDYASRLYAENGRYFKNVRSSIPTPLRYSSTTVVEAFFKSWGTFWPHVAKLTGFPTS